MLASGARQKSHQRHHTQPLPGKRRAPTGGDSTVHSHMSYVITVRRAERGTPWVRSAVMRRQRQDVMYSRVYFRLIRDSISPATTNL